MSSAFTSIEIFKESPPNIPRMVAKKILEHVTIYELGKVRYLEYFDGPLIICDEGQKKTLIYCTNSERLYELSLLSIHSLLGQRLEEFGVSRLHAVAFSLRDKNFILMLPSRGGKSTLLSKALEDPEVRIIADDMPLCDLKGKIYPFPSKMSLDQIPSNPPLAFMNWNQFKRYHHPDKWVLSLSQFSERLDTHPMERENYLMAGFRVSSQQGLVREVHRFKMIGPMIEHMIIGLGLPQIIEMFLKFNFSDVFKLLHHGLVRSRCAYQLVKKSRCFYIYLGKDTSSNLDLVKELLNDK